MEVLEKHILSVIQDKRYRPVKKHVLAKQLGIGDDLYPDFKASIDSLHKKGRLVIGPKKLICPPQPSDQLTGRFQANPRGFGFIVPEQETSYGDLFVAPNDTADAMNGDTVVAKVVKKGHRQGQVRYSGIIIDILDRALSRAVGELQFDEYNDYWFIQPEGKNYFNPIYIDDVTATDARQGDKVVVDITSYPRKDQMCRGAIVRILGKTGKYEAETLSIIERYNLAGDFSKVCRKQAQKAAEQFDPDNAPGRDDITSEVTVTIDPDDARDFDDAITLRKNRDGNWILGVHIADVSTFIPMGSPLDIEAGIRGNSVYLPRKVIPMLPEILSNGICSLVPGQKRFTKSVYITYDKKGNILGREFANSIIQSNARLTYLQADSILRGHQKGHAEAFSGDVVAILKDMEDLAHAIESRRNKNGMLHLDLPETELIYDDEGNVIDAEKADDSYPHTIIEMFMVEANEAVASLLDRFQVPFMRRIHPEPENNSKKDIGRFVKLCGIKVPRNLDRNTIQDLLEAVKGTSASFAVNMYILRSLQKAEYSPLHIGHFALASTHYCHFTSPIRRYSDLMVHRLLQCYLDHSINKIGLEEVLPEGELKKIGKHISFTEQNAADAERELKTILILQMLSRHPAMELECVVSGLTNFGVFVQCTKYGIEGLIEPGDLGLDEWKYDEKNQAVIGKYSGKSVHLGESVRVKIASINIPSRQLFLAPCQPLVDNRKESKKSYSKGKKSKGRGRR